MSPVASLLVSFLLMLPIEQPAGDPAVPSASLASEPVVPPDPLAPDWQPLSDAFRAPVQAQVRIEQRMTIRIAPHGAAPMAPVLVPLPRAGMPPRLEERRMGKCLPISGIAGVQAEGRSRLLLFMRDRRIVSAELEKACRARDFYSGFYVERHADGQICIDRDKLQSRAGANCSLTRLRQLVVVED